MDSKVNLRSAATADEFGPGSELAALVRSEDWLSTPLGPLSTWSVALKTVVDIVLANRFPQLYGGAATTSRSTTTLRTGTGCEEPLGARQPFRDV